jgi:hypothetical protein
MRTKLELTARREETWLEATEQGWTAARIATAAGVSVQYVRRLVARARASRGETSETSSIPEPSELPRLELTDSETRGANLNGLTYSLATDAVSLDGGSTWIPPDDPSTPRMSVLASDHTGRGLRKHRLEPRPYQAPPEPPGPTSYRPAKGLKGGRGS